ncbi:hypothetical protein ACH5RR_031441 [Cinchona calisaya]|uniref:Uncharacterized protein n=1 Tax=Cinchona calisaya TaxID=153742 RepID=A0ABD2YI76_9GENT
MKRLISFALFTIIFVLFFLHLQPGQATRVLHGQEKELMEKAQILLQSLPKGPVPPSDPSGCTYIPGSGGTGCPIKQMNFAGGGGALHRAASAYPRPTFVRFGVASNEK